MKHNIMKYNNIWNAAFYKA